MKGLNKQVLMGNVGGDMELKHTQSGVAFLNFRLATNETYKNRDGELVTDTEWHSVVAWERSAEVIAEYVKKGDPIYVEGKTVHRQYDDKDGVTRYVTEVKLREFTLLSRGDGNGNGAGESEGDSAPAPGKSSPRGRAAAPRGGKADVADDDLPF